MREIDENYKSDYSEMVEQGGFVKVDGYGKQHNVLVFEGDVPEGLHEHAGYDYKSGKTFWHGMFFQTKHNNPEGMYRAESEKSIENHKNIQMGDSSKGLSNAELLDFINECNDKDKLKDIRKALFGEEADDSSEEQKILKR